LNKGSFLVSSVLLLVGGGAGLVLGVQVPIEVSRMGPNWRFPEMGVILNHPFYWDFHYTP
jgi:hypothetical protein